MLLVVRNGVFCQLPTLPVIYLARHGETNWTISRQHTGRTDIPLTPRGETNARQLGSRLAGVEFARVFTSPLQRARRTCELAGFGDRAEIDLDLVEMDYGRYEGCRTEDIRQETPDWDLFRDGCPGGESVAAITARVDRVIERLRGYREGNTLLFTHMHFLRFLAARWIGLAASEGRRFVLGTASLSILGYDHTLDDMAIRLWNDDRHVTP
jgi:probable phosphoglycerate mutase